MIGSTIAGVLIELLSYWGDPDGSKSHSLDVVELTSLVLTGRYQEIVHD
jgi:hypothetical protein